MNYTQFSVTIDAFNEDALNGGPRAVVMVDVSSGAPDIVAAHYSRGMTAGANAIDFWERLDVRQLVAGLPRIAAALPAAEPLAELPAGPSEHGTPAARRVVDELRDKIRDGSYPPGSRMPLRRELQSLYPTVPLSAINKAIGILQAEGLLGPGTAAGTLVLDPTRPARKAAAARGRHGQRGAYGKAPEDILEQLSAIGGSPKRLSQHLNVPITTLASWIRRARNKKRLGSLPIVE